MLPKPTKYKDWLIFKNTRPQEENVLNCSNTITGKCYTASSVKTCINDCEKDENCDFGYYVGRNCMNMDKESYPLYFNPSLYWDGTNDNITSFLNTKKLSFPQLLSNAVYFSDKILLKNKEKNLLLQTPFSQLKSHEEIVTPIEFKNDGSILEVGYSSPYNPKIIENTNILYKYPVILKIKNTNYIIRDLGDNVVGWILRGNTEIMDSDEIYLYPINNIDDKPRYGESFRMTINNQGLLGLDKENILKIYYYNTNEGITDTLLNKLSNDEIATIFEFIPQVNVYYCKNNKCEDILLSDTINGKVDGKDTYRRNDCYDQCNHIENNDDKLTALLTVIVIIILILVIFRLNKIN